MVKLQSSLPNSICFRMLQRTLPAGFIAPCLPTKTDKLPSGSQWVHEIKHDGFRVIARKKGAQVRLYSRPGNDLTHRFPLIVEALSRLRSRSCIIDGEAVACDDNGVASFDLIRHIIDQLTETKSNTELRLLSRRLQRLAFHAAPSSGDGR
jgi:ATP-dependent DNA ligase